MAPCLNYECWPFLPRSGAAIRRASRLLPAQLRRSGCEPPGQPCCPESSSPQNRTRTSTHQSAGRHGLLWPSDGSSPDSQWHARVGRGQDIAQQTIRPAIWRFRYHRPTRTTDAAVRPSRVLPAPIVGVNQRGDRCQERGHDIIGRTGGGFRRGPDPVPPFGAEGSKRQSRRRAPMQPQHGHILFGPSEFFAAALPPQTNAAPRCRRRAYRHRWRRDRP